MTKKLDELDDAALGKLLRKQIKNIRGAAEELKTTTIYAAALILCYVAQDHAGEIDITLEGLTQCGVEVGDWQVKIIKVKS